MVTRAEQFAKSQDALKNAWVDINKYNAAIAGGSSVEDALKAGGWTWQKAQTTNASVKQASDQKTQEVMNKYNQTANELSSMTGKTSNSINQNTNRYKDSDWYYSATERNAATGGAEFWTRQTTTTASTPNTWWTDYKKVIRDAWDKKSYEEQQDFLSKNPSMKQTIEQAGWVFKTSPEVKTEETAAKLTETEWATKQWQRDYQDNSPERMAEIAKNLEEYKKNMPYLFSDKQAFDDFFINWVNRSQEQIDFLNDWFYKNQKYGKYDALTPDSVWYWVAYWDIPEEYLTMLKSTDPEKYQLALQAKQDAEDKIKDRTSLDSIDSMTWAWEDSITSAAIEWLKSQWLFVDKDWNLVDDRTENYATGEEKWYAKNAADIIARNLEIDNIVKHTYDDLVKAYPWATKATLMAMAQDRNSDLLREKENNNVELTRLQWYMDYMQSERQERNNIWQNAINQLQKQYGMYYQYTPEWMSELAQAQYAATNVTLTQADTGTYTQKQMAVDAALTPYYEMYWDVLFTSKAEAIDQAINYAVNNWVSLQTALNETFYKSLYNNPYYLQKVSWDNWWVGKREVIWEDELWNKVYWFVNTTTWVVIPYWNVAWWTAGWYWYTTWWVASEWWYLDIPRTWNNIWADTNNFWNITSMVDGAIWMYHSPNGRDYAVFATAEDWYNALVKDLQWKKTWNTRTWLNWNSTVAELIWTWVNGSWTVDPNNYYAKAFTKATWLSLNDRIWNVSAETLAKWIMAWEWTLDAYNKWWKDLTAYAWQAQPKWTTQSTANFDKNLANVYDEYSSASAKDKAQIAARQWKSTQQMDAEVYAYEWWRNAKDLEPLLDVVERLLNWDIKIPWQYQRMDTAWIDFWLNWFVPWTIKESNRNWMAAHNYIYNTLWMDKFLDLKSKGATFWALSEDERQAIYDAATMFKADLWEEEYKRQLRQIEKTIKEAGRWYLDNYTYSTSTINESAIKAWLVKTQTA